MLNRLQAAAAQPESAITLRDAAELLSHACPRCPIGQDAEPTVGSEEQPSEREDEFESKTICELKTLAQQLGVKRVGVGWAQACPPDGNKAAVIAALRRWKFTAAGNYTYCDSRWKAAEPRSAVKPPPPPSSSSSGGGGGGEGGGGGSSLPITGLNFAATTHSSTGGREQLLRLLQETAAGLEAELLLLTHEASTGTDRRNKGKGKSVQQYDHQKGMREAGIVSGRQGLLGSTLLCNERVATVVR